ncbi:MAG: hypothetical protein PHH73_06635 [Candidatus Rickettsiella isopodorum]|nr:hypothetical protein [Candidatus Rickettsiella isopodorum]
MITTSITLNIISQIYKQINKICRMFFLKRIKNWESITKSINQIEYLANRLSEISLNKNRDSSGNILISIKQEIIKLNFVLVNECKIECFQDHLINLKHLLEAIEVIKLYNFEIPPLKFYLEKNYRKEEDIKNIEDILNNNNKGVEISQYQSFKLFVTGISILLTLNDRDLELYTRYIQKFINDLLILLRKYIDFYYKKNKIEIKKLIDEHKKSKLSFLIGLNLRVIIEKERDINYIYDLLFKDKFK